jgi:hypothetical protein
MTITRPWRLMILHFSHIGFTDGLTFTAATSKSPVFFFPRRARGRFFPLARGVDMLRISRFGGRRLQKPGVLSAPLL